MPTDLRLDEVREKLTALQTALFYDLSDSVLKLPVSVIKILTIDELGQIWFAMPVPFSSFRECNSNFLSELHFFRKGQDFYVNITGKAHTVSDPEELNNTLEIPQGIKLHVVAGALTLVKVKIRTADYFERKCANATRDYKTTLSQFFTKLFRDSQENYFNYRVLHLDRG